MTLTQISRKRPRTCEEEGCEFMPISKRINDLHIRSNNVSEAVLPGSQNGVSTCMHAGMVSFSQMCHQTVCESAELANCSARPERQCMQNIVANAEHYNVPNTYSPELDASRNPYYYHINGILFEAHLQRLQRLTKCQGHCHENT